MRVLPAALVALVSGSLVAACGGQSSGAASGGTAKSLLSDSFSGAHSVNSGVLDASLTVMPAGSSVLKGPIVISFSGPFQSRGAKALPASRFTAGIQFEGEHGQLTFTSTGTAGYVTLSGTNYALPASSFKSLEGGVSSVGGSGASGSGVFSKLGIDPKTWVSSPKLVGTATIGGAKTEHIHGGIAVGAVLSDLSTLLAKAPSVSTATTGGAAVPKSISPATQAKIKAAVKDASFDLWTGSSDHTIRRLTVSARIPVNTTGEKSLGGLSALTISFTLAYSDVGQHQTIATPANPQPYSGFEAKVSSVVSEIEELVASSEASH